MIMALENQLNATTGVYWASFKPENIIDKASALLWKLLGNARVNDDWEVKAHETVDGGSMIKVPLKYANSNHGSYGADTVINQSKTNIIDAARFGWGGAYGSNTLNLNDKIKNSGDEAIISLTKEYMESIKESARVDMASQVMGAKSTTDAINGLLDLFNISAAGVEGATSVEYGSIAESTMSDWKSNVITTAADISFETMQDIFREPNMGDVDSKLPNFVVTTALLKDAYELSLHPQQRYTDNEMVSAGWRNIMHKGAPIVSDSNVTTGWLFALNLNYLKLRAHKDYNFTQPVWVSKEVLGQPDTISANTRWVGNLICTNRKMHVLHVNLTKAV
jgi:hypothetical protein